MAIEVAPETGRAHTALEIAALALFVALLVVFHIVPGTQMRLLGRIARRTIPAGNRQRRLATALQDLEPEQRSAVTAVLRDGLSPNRAADRAGLSACELCATFVQGLRLVAGRQALVTGQDAAIGSYLLSSEPPAERDALARELWGMGVDPIELHELESTYRALSRTSRRSWLAVDDARSPC